MFSPPRLTDKTEISRMLLLQVFFSIKMCASVPLYVKTNHFRQLTTNPRFLFPVDMPAKEENHFHYLEGCVGIVSHLSAGF